jgi:hypothetical protein
MIQALRRSAAYTFAMNTTREQGLLAWQWSIYADGHRDRRNLAVHALTEPLFVLGSVGVVAAPIIATWSLAALGIGLMMAAMALQGRFHKCEATPPAPFRGPIDVLARIFAEQWITFPRYVLSGGFSRAWRAA